MGGLKTIFILGCCIIGGVVEVAWPGSSFFPMVQFAPDDESCQYGIYPGGRLPAGRQLSQSVVFCYVGTLSDDEYLGVMRRFSGTG
jgi:hypothetical protein